MRMITLLFLIASTAMIGCKKEDNETAAPTTTSNTSNTQGANNSSSSNLVGYEKWENGKKNFEVKFTLNGSNVVVGYEIPTGTTTHSFTVTGDKVTQVKQDNSGTVSTYDVVYGGDTLKGVKVNGSLDYEFEIDKATGRVSQLNEKGIRSYQFYYNSNQNLDSVILVQGSGNTKITFTYDSNTNPFFDDNNLRAFTVPQEMFAIAPRNWALDVFLTFTKNNITQIDRVSPLNTQTTNNTFHYTNSQLDSVVSVWSLTPSNPTTYVMKY